MGGEDPDPVFQTWTEWKAGVMQKAYGATNMHHPLAERIIQRSIYNCMLEGSSAMHVNYQVSWDAAVSKRGPREYRKWTLVQLALRCWGEVGEGDGWGDHGIHQAMKHAHSPDLATVIRAYLGDDHRENVEREVLPYLRWLLDRTQITIEHMLLTLPPILLDENFKLEKHLPRMEDRWVAVESVPVKVHGAIGVDGAAALELAGLTYHDEQKASPFNDDVYKHRGEIAEIFELPQHRSLEDECKARWPRLWKDMLAIVLWMNDEGKDWTSCTRRPPEREKRRTGPQAAGSSARRPGFRAAPGSDTRAARNRSVPAAAKEWEWESKGLRDAGLKFDEFEPNMRGDTDGTLRAGSMRLVRMPFVALFGRDDLPDVLGGEAKVPGYRMVIGLPDPN